LLKISLKQSREVDANFPFSELGPNGHVPAYMRQGNIPEYSSRIFVSGDGVGRLSASLDGEKSELPAFYQMLEGTRELK
jgi:hypothetical protein